MVKIYWRISNSQPWYWGQSLNWLIYKVFWWLRFLLAIKFSIFLSVKPCNLSEAIHQISDCKEQDESWSHPHFLFHYKLFFKLPYISKLFNLNCFFKVSLKAIILGLHRNFAMAYIWRFSLFSYKCFSDMLHIVKENPFMKMNMTK